MHFNLYPSHLQVVPNSSPCSKTKWNDGGHNYHGHFLLNHDVHLKCDGYCTDCGIVQTHLLACEFATMTTADGGQSSSTVIVHKEPLTVQGKVYQGRCMLCHPLVLDNIFLGYEHQDQEHHRQHEQQTQIHAIPQEEEADHLLQEQRSHPQQESKEMYPKQQQQELEVEDEENEILDILCNMHHHPHNLQLHISCFHSLWILSWETQNALAIGRIGGIPILLEILRQHLDSHLIINNRYNRNNNTSSPSFVQQMQLQVNGLTTLQNLSVNEYNADLIVEHLGIDLILLSILTFIHNPELVCSGCNALVNILSNCNGSYKCTILSNGGFEIVLKIVGIVHNNQNEGVMRAAYNCLYLLGLDVVAQT